VTSAYSFFVKIIVPLLLVAFSIQAEWTISYDLQSEEIQLVGQWAPLVGVALVLIAAFVGKYWPKGEAILLRFRSRRKLVKRNGIKERRLESLIQAWKGKEERSTWSQAGVVLFQGVDVV
jgi:hypothetical protein